ncbi:GSCOCG00010708001-RA-CDS [Cotesia congregata]|nr:GSCOCG00010708001-RA-CDS [Cotesia congregata]
MKFMQQFLNRKHLEDVRIQLPYAVISTVMRQHQKEAVDELPELPTYKDFAEFFERNENLCFMRYADKKYVIVSNLENDALLIGDPEFSKSGQCDTIHISSTANILPDFNGTRLLTFILGQDGHYAFPVGIILWTKVARDACTEILNQVKERLFPNVNITKIYVDFDLKLFVEEVFPESDVRGTFNNYCHILFHEALSNNDLRLRIPEHEEFLKKCFSLILLPSNKIKEGFEEISNSLSVETKAQLTNFINYFNRVWIEGVTPTSMSLYEKVESLNTVPVLFRTTLENYMGEKPSLWKFWSNFIVLLNKSTNERQRRSIKKNSYISVSIRFNLCFNKKPMISLWRSLTKSKITLPQFLSKVAIYYTDHYWDLLHSAEFLIEEQLDLYPPLENEGVEEAIDNDLEEVYENIQYANYEMEEDFIRGNDNEGNDEDEFIILEIPSTNCEICITGPRQMIVIPCHHYRMCFDCSTKIREIANKNNLLLKCPFCNSPAQEFSRVF